MTTAMLRAQKDTLTSGANSTRRFNLAAFEIQNVCIFVAV